MTIHNREDLDAFPPAGFPDFVAAALGRGKRRIDEALALVKRSFLTQSIRQLSENVAQHLAFAPLLEAAMHRFVVGRALRQHVPLRTGVQNPQDGLQDASGRHRFAAGAAFGEVLLGKMFPNPFPVFIAQPQHRGAL
jgi:hypothetical protein